MKTLLKIAIIIALFSEYSYSQSPYQWFPINTGITNDLNCINNNWIAGSGGILLKSTDNGYNWFVFPSGTTNDLKSISKNLSNLFICGSNGTIVRSTNDGLNWSLIPTGITNTLNSVSKTWSGHVIAVGTGGKIIITSNNGTNWVSVSSSTTVDLNSVSTIGNYGWAVGSNGVIIKTTDWGVSWSVVNSGVTTNLNFIYFSNSTTGWILGSNGNILKTTDIGNTWVGLNSGTNANLKAFYSPAWAAGDGGIVIWSINGGLNWSQQNVGPNIDWNSIYSNGGEMAWVAGKNGKLYQRKYDSLYTPWKVFSPNNISTFINCSGIFNQDKRTLNTPGFQWPIGSGHFAIFSSGLNIAAKYNGVLRMASASYNGEYTAGYITDSSGISVARTDNRFRIYSVKRGDNASTNQNWAEWGQMIPFGAPYVDVNGNHQYDPATDTPGIKGASQTIFICMTDGFSSSHNPGEGFGGGTLPLYAEVHLTAWGFNTIPGLENVHFLNWDVINKSKVQWQSTYFSIYNDADLGNADDDYIGCDTTLGLGYCYNGDDDDEQNSNTYNYGIHPPAVGMMFLNCIPGYASLSSFDFTLCAGCGAPSCELDSWDAPSAYNYMQGYKQNGATYFIPITIPPQRTKFNFSGDPETGNGWEASDGRIINCDSMPYPYYPPQKTDQRMILNYGSQNKNLNPNDTQKILIAQLIARGSTNLNSVTLLKQLSSQVKTLCNNGAIFGVKEISSQVPAKYKLYQNYPNPFNPTTKIIASLGNSQGGKQDVKLVIYDVLGKIVAEFTPPTGGGREGLLWEIEWDASNFATGVYFYSLIVDNKVIDTKKLVFLK